MMRRDLTLLAVQFAPVALAALVACVMAGIFQ